MTQQLMTDPKRNMELIPLKSLPCIPKKQAENPNLSSILFQIVATRSKFHRWTLPKDGKSRSDYGCTAAKSLPIYCNERFWQIHMGRYRKLPPSDQNMSCESKYFPKANPPLLLPCITFYDFVNRSYKGYQLQNSILILTQKRYIV